MEHLLATCIRTETVFKNRSKHLKDHDAVKICNCEPDKLNANSGPLLCDLKVRGEISVDSKGNFKALRKGPVDPSLSDRTGERERIRAALTLLHSTWQHATSKLLQQQLQQLHAHNPHSSAGAPLPA